VLPEEIQKLRKSLSCTAKELATALGVDPKEVAAWESGELFPTKKHVEKMLAFQEKGASAIVRAPRGKPPAKRGLDRLTDPELWALIRKLIEHPALFEDVRKLAEKYADPAEPPTSKADRT
jgi:transcriptional regulator with XRE-family HTH domain